MSDFSIYVIASAIAYSFSLLGVRYALDKSRSKRASLVVAIIVAFSTCNALLIKISNNKIPVEAVTKSWSQYATYCKEEHVSWDEFTFLDWLNMQASE